MTYANYVNSIVKFGFKLNLDTLHANFKLWSKHFMEFNANKIDAANAVVTSTFTKETLEANLNKVAKEAAKNMNISGFRKGKVPVNVVKARYGEKLQQDAEAEAFRLLLIDALKELDIDNSDVIGEPSITKFDKKEDGSIDVEVAIASKPVIELGDYKALVPEVEAQEASDEEIDARIADIAKNSAELTKIKRKRMVKDGDFALIDFEGFIDGEAFPGGQAEKYPLEVGSNSFIPGFEEQIIGMKYEDEKDVTVSFPEEYQAKDLAGKEAVFKVKLHEIQEKVAPEVDDELAKKMLPGEEDATVESLKAKVKEQIDLEKKQKYYAEELKPAFLDKLVDGIDFALPTTVVDQEINVVLNNQVRSMSEDELEKLKDDAEQIEKMREEAKPEASKSVKATFIVDALAKAEQVDITDQEVTQVLYYEAMQMGQNPQDVIKQYTDNGYLPAIKMSMIEDRVITKLLDEKLGK